MTSLTLEADLFSKASCQTHLESHAGLDTGNPFKRKLSSYCSAKQVIMSSCVEMFGLSRVGQAELPE
jgi:hypothetical protein